MRPRSVTIIGILSVVLGAIQILGLPLAILIINVWMREESLLKTVLLTPVMFLVANYHWEPNTGAAAAILIDIPLAIVLLRSGRRTLDLQPAGRRLALLYAGIVLGIESANAAFIAANWADWRALVPIDISTAGFSLARKILYPIVLIVFFTRPGIRAIFLPKGEA